MAGITTGSITGTVALLAAIASTLADDGWTMDRVDSTRLHVHKGGVHFEIYQFSINSFLGLIGCTGYQSGSAPTAQPGASPVGLVYFHTGSDHPTNYRIISTGTSIIIQTHNPTSGIVNFSACGEITDKCGTWTGGQFVLGCGGAVEKPWQTSHVLNVFINGSWAPNASYGGGGGLYTSTARTLASRMPFGYNAGILRLPITAYLKNVSTPTLFHPIGYAPHMYMMRGGDVYAIGDTVTIDAVDYLAIGETVHPSVVTATVLVAMV